MPVFSYFIFKSYIIHYIYLALSKTPSAKTFYWSGCCCCQLVAGEQDELFIGALRERSAPLAVPVYNEKHFTCTGNLLFLVIPNLFGIKLLI
jgi:hypothetical protein